MCAGKITCADASHRCHQPLSLSLWVKRERQERQREIKVGKKPKKGLHVLIWWRRIIPAASSSLFCWNSAALNYCTKYHMAFIVHLRKDVGFDLEPSWQQRSNIVTQSVFMPFKQKGDYKITKSACFFLPQSVLGWKGNWSLCCTVTSAAAQVLLLFAGAGGGQGARWHEPSQVIGLRWDVVFREHQIRE